MSKMKWSGNTLLMPLPPIMVSCGTEGKENIITIAWTGIINSQPPKTYISVRPERFSHGIISKTGEFVINLTTEQLLRAADLCGMRSGRDINKFAACKLTPLYPDGVTCPLIAEAPLSLVCKVSDTVSLGSHDMFLADIVEVYVNAELIDEKGKLRMERAGLIAYAHGDYFALGRRLGSFGLSVKKRTSPKRPPRRQQ